MNNLPTKSMFTDLVWPIISIRKEIITKKTGEMLMSMDLVWSRISEIFFVQEFNKCTSCLLSLEPPSKVVTSTEFLRELPGLCSIYKLTDG